MEDSSGEGRSPADDNAELLRERMESIRSQKDIATLSEPQLKYILMKSGRVAIKTRMTKEEMATAVKEMWCEFHNVDPNSIPSAPDNVVNTEKVTFRRATTRDHGTTSDNVRGPRPTPRKRNTVSGSVSGDNKPKTRTRSLMLGEGVQAKYSSVMENLLEQAQDQDQASWNKPKTRPRSLMLGEGVQAKYSSVMENLVDRFGKTTGNQDQSSNVTNSTHDIFPDVFQQTDGDLHSDRDQSGPNQDTETDSDKETTSSTELETRAVQCLKDISSLEIIPKLTIRQLKTILKENNFDITTLCERSEYEKQVSEFWKLFIGSISAND